MLVVALLCTASLVLFFNHHRAVASVAIVDTVVADTTGDVYSEQDYFNQMADEFEAVLPDDKVVLARLIDSVNHCVLYYETGYSPSCYSYDLESLTTSVVFGGENGFYSDTKLLMPGAVQQWRRVGDWVVFVTSNRAPETDITNAVIVFSLNVYNREILFIDKGSEALFSDSVTLTVNKSTLLYRQWFTGEDVYTTTTDTYKLQF